jgi:hypothetical protein
MRVGYVRWPPCPVHGCAMTRGMRPKRAVWECPAGDQAIPFRECSTLNCYRQLDATIPTEHTQGSRVERRAPEHETPADADGRPTMSVIVGLPPPARRSMHLNLHQRAALRL